MPAYTHALILLYIRVLGNVPVKSTHILRPSAVEQEEDQENGQAEILPT